MADDDNWVDQSAGNLIGDDVQYAELTRDDADNERAKAPPGWLERLFGYDRAKAQGADFSRQPLEDRTYPDKSALPEARKWDTAYGENAAPYIAGNAKIATIPVVDAPAFINKRKPIDTYKPIDEAVSEQMARAHSASQRSAIAKIGFDPSHIAVSPSSPRSLDVSGTYTPKIDQIWYDSDYPNTAVHESLHRGLQKLQEAGQYKKGEHFDEELLVRALMTRYFGNAEVPFGDKDQIAEARARVPKQLLDDLEAKAAQHYANKRPRGPR